ncbi:MAG: LapA family protein [Acidimicrobiales bacterium]
MLVAVANTDDVEIDLLYDEYVMPLFVLIAAVGVAGFLAGSLVAWRRRV